MKKIFILDYYIPKINNIKIIEELLNFIIIYSYHTLMKYIFFFILNNYFLYMKIS
jgi:hypothetical protein